MNDGEIISGMEILLADREYTATVCPDCYAQRDLAVPTSSVNVGTGVALMLPSGERLKKTVRDQHVEFCLICRWYREV